MIVGTGLDVVEIARIERALERRGDRFARRLFAAGELEAVAQARRTAPLLAVRFAAKEAILKALGTGLAEGIRWHDIVTRSSGDGGDLSVELLGRAVLAFLRALELIFQPPDLALRFVALLPLTLDLRDHLLAAIQESRKRLLSADRALSHILQLPAQFTAIRVDPLLQRVCSPSRPPTG